jgi:SAM-dependent methyltransferase
MKLPDVDWKKRAYQGYVSSGQAGASMDARHPFVSRAPYIRDVIKRHISPDRNQVIVDLGCGSGAYLYFLRQLGYNSIKGVDGSKEQVELAHQIGLTSVEHGDLLDYLSKHSNCTIDTILLMDVLEHMTRPEIFQLFDEIWRVLKHGGKCLLHVPNAEGIFGNRVFWSDITHETAFTPRSMQQIMALVGFSRVECFEDKPIPHNFNSTLRRLIWDTATIYPRLLLLAETGKIRSVLSQNMLVSVGKD